MLLNKEIEEKKNLAEGTIKNQNIKFLFLQERKKRVQRKLLKSPRQDSQEEPREDPHEVAHEGPHGIPHKEHHEHEGPHEEPHERHHDEPREDPRMCMEEDQSCCLSSVTVNLTSIGWDFVLNPQQIEFTYCRGHCDPFRVPPGMFVPQMAALRWVRFIQLMKLTQILKKFIII